MSDFLPSLGAFTNAIGFFGCNKCASKLGMVINYFSDIPAGTEKSKHIVWRKALQCKWAVAFSKVTAHFYAETCRNPNPERP